MVRGQALEQNTFGIREFAEAAGPLAKAREDISLKGFTVLEGVLDTDELTYARRALDRLYAEQMDECGGEDRVALINDIHTVRAPLVADEFFLRVATKPAVLEVVRSILGDYVALMLQNGLINPPMVGQQHNAGAWHRDLNYQHWVSSRPLSVSALFCIDRFSSETGGTAMLPHSHRVEAFPSSGYVAANEVIMEAEAGSVLVFDSMIFHRGGLNRSDAPRRAINHMYTIPLLKPQISFARAMGGRHSEDPFLRQFLGYDTEPADSARDFREMRIARQAG